MFSEESNQRFTQINYDNIAESLNNQDTEEQNTNNQPDT